MLVGGGSEEDVVVGWRDWAGDLSRSCPAGGSAGGTGGGTSCPAGLGAGGAAGGGALAAAWKAAARALSRALLISDLALCLFLRRPPSWMCGWSGWPRLPWNFTEVLPFLHLRDSVPSFPDFQRWINSVKVAKRKPASVLPSKFFISIKSVTEGAAATGTGAAARTAYCLLFILKFIKRRYYIEGI